MDTLIQCHVNMLLTFDQSSAAAVLGLEVAELELDAVDSLDDDPLPESLIELALLVARLSVT